MSYLIAVFPDRITAEAAYSSLEKADIPMAAVSVLGRGYQSADEYGLIDPADTAWQQIRLMMLWLVPFGFLAGFSFNAITGLDTFPWAGTLGNQFLGGLLGAGSGALGAFFVGGGVGLSFGSGDAISYRNRLNAGKYLLIVEGTEGLIGQASRLLRQHRPENLQGYTEQRVKPSSPS